LLPYMTKAGFLPSNPSEAERAKLLNLTKVVKERLKVLGDVVDLTRFLFEEPKYEDVNLFAAKGVELEVALAALDRAYAILRQGFEEHESHEATEQKLTDLASEMGLKINGVFMPLRVALTGSTVSLPLFDSIGLLGQEVTCARIENALALLKREV